MSNTLQRLRGADHVLRLAGRDRPCGFRSSLAERGSRPDLSGEMIARAVQLLDRVAALPSRIARVVGLACETRHAQPRYSRSEIAQIVGASVRTITSDLASGLRMIEDAESAASGRSRHSRTHGVDTLREHTQN
jgi:hypothetical protein